MDNNKKTCLVLTGLLLITIQNASGNIFTDFYNSMFHDGIMAIELSTKSDRTNNDKGKQGKEVVSSTRLPFYKQNRIISFSNHFKTSTIEHRIVLGDALIVGTVFMVGYYTYKKWLNHITKSVLSNA